MPNTYKHNYERERKVCKCGKFIADKYAVCHDCHWERRWRLQDDRKKLKYYGRY